jgi:hypothetical protein
MRKRPAIGLVCIAVIAAAVLFWPGRDVALSDSGSAALIDDYCTGCHNEINDVPEPTRDNGVNRDALVRVIMSAELL